MFQSTHPHGVRLGVKVVRAFSACFNPRTHTGCDRADFEKRQGHCKFQSTHPHGVRLRYCHIFGHHIFVSIHAPTRGATRLLLPRPRLFPVSIHAPTRGATKDSNKGYLSVRVSIHAPTRGATARTKLKKQYDRFQSTHPHGVRRRKVFSVAVSARVSIHAPTRGATL